MAHNSHNSQDGAQGFQHHDSTYFYSATSHVNTQCGKLDRIAQDVSYSHQYDLVASEYPQGLAESDLEHVQPDQQPLQDSRYREVPRSWAQPRTAPFDADELVLSDHEHDTRSIPTYESHLDRSEAMEAEERSLTEPSTSGMAKWAQQDQLAGPWDGVGSVPERSP